VPRVLRALLVGGLAVLLVFLAAPPLATRLAGERLRHAATARGFQVGWQRLRLGWDARAEISGLAVTLPAAGDTVFAAESLEVAVDPWALLALHPRVTRVGVFHAAARLPGRGTADPDTLAPEPERRDRRVDPRRAAGLRRSAESLVGLLLTPARRLPALALRDVTLRAPLGADAVWSGFRLSWLESRPEAGGMRLAAVGAILGEREMPFEASLRHARDDRVQGGLRVTWPGGATGGPTDVMVVLDGAITQDRRQGTVVIHDSTRVTLGRIPFRLGARLDRQGPRLRFDIEAKDLTEAAVRASLPEAVLGPLLDLEVTGAWDYRVDLDLDLSEPDSVRFQADVIPHGLAIDPTRTRLLILGLDQPFVAAIHLPHDRIVLRELSPANPFFRPLPGISPALVGAVMTNEDGGFFHHRGFNTDAVRAAIAENLKAGAFRRGAGTITMQLARNLYLGHDRTLSRKFREVVLAWILEHLTGLPKERLLEIYLNIIEWGPDVHGAGEAAHYYFDRDPADLTVEEALFLATVVPAPAKWRYRFDGAGALRPFERAQMHFIGRAMVAKGLLDPAALPPSDSLAVTLRGPARATLFPEAAAAPDSSVPNP
jgi:transglycosylase-like protein